MRGTSGSKINAARGWAEQAGYFVNGWGPGLGATRVDDRERDVAAYERQRASLPKRPPAQKLPQGED